MRILQLVLVVVFLGAMASSLSARTWHVTPDGTGDFPTIQAGIDAATDGDTVLLAKGFFMGEGNRDIDYHGKAITVRSELGQQRTVINLPGMGTESHRGFVFRSGEDSCSVLEGVYIAAGYVTGDDVLAYGGAAILCIDSSPRISQCLFAGNISYNREPERPSGGAICCVRSSPTFIDCDFVANDCRSICPSNYGGGLFCSDSSPVLVRCLFRGNRARNGGGFASINSYPTLRECTFADNYACTSRGDGGGLFCSGSSPVLVRCNFDRNRARNGGGFASINSYPTLRECTFADNRAYGTRSDGGGLAMSGTADLFNCWFDGNEAREGEGGGISWTGDLNMKNCRFTDNRAYKGGGIKCSSGGGEITNCEFVDNDAGEGGGLNCGGGATISNCVIQGNTAGAGGGGSLSAIVKLVDCVISDNFAYSGGGVYTEGGHPNLTSCEIRNNTGGHGGGVKCQYYSKPRFEDCLIVQNNGQVRGGGVYMDSAIPEFVNCTIAQNKGGGIKIANFSRPSIHNSIVAFNGGAGIAGPNRVEFGNISCCDVYGNGGGDWVGDITDHSTEENNFSRDPLFCELGNGNYALDGGSPCLPENNECGERVGAKSVGCGTVTTKLEISQRVLNINKRGKIPVKLHGSETLDIRQIEISSLELNGVRPTQTQISRHESELNLKFDVPGLMERIPDASQSDKIVFTLVGYRVDGIRFEARDSVKVIANGPLNTTHNRVSKTVEVTTNPNPFNPVTRITYVLTTQSHVRLSVYDVAGRLVDRLVNEVKPAGEHVVEWNAQDRPSGIYFCRLETGAMAKTHKLVLLK